MAEDVYEDVFGTAYDEVYFGESDEEPAPSQSPSAGLLILRRSTDGKVLIINVG